MTDAMQVEPEWLDHLSRQLRASAEELEKHAERFAVRCGGVGDAYGSLAEGQEAGGRYQVAVDSMNDYLTRRIAEQQAQADALTRAAEHYRAAQTEALEAIRWDARKAPYPGFPGH
ncbi:hypothetical protein ACIA8E_40935 [Streptomyces sp. NPDC051664]|uniref:hypothetical protein n=1 Tax=Streptomyces sp. NPDC051664 TaxID=3365668 RepID=UPI003792824A